MHQFLLQIRQNCSRNFQDVKEDQTDLFCMNCGPVILSNLHGVVPQEFVPQGQTANQHLSSDVLQHLWKICSRNLRRGTWRFVSSLQQCSCSSALCVKEFLASSAMTVFLHPLCSLDPLSCDFFIFLKLRLPLKVRTLMTSAQFSSSCRLHLHVIK